MIWSPLKVPWRSNAAAMVAIVVCCDVYLQRGRYRPSHDLGAEYFALPGSALTWQRPPTRVLAPQRSLARMDAICKFGELCDCWALRLRRLDPPQNLDPPGSVQRTSLLDASNDAIDPKATSNGPCNRPNFVLHGHSRALPRPKPGRRRRACRTCPSAATIYRRSRLVATLTSP